MHQRTSPLDRLIGLHRHATHARAAKIRGVDGGGGGGGGDLPQLMGHSRNISHFPTSRESCLAGRLCNIITHLVTSSPVWDCM